MQRAVSQSVRSCGSATPLSNAAWPSHRMGASAKLAADEFVVPTTRNPPIAVGEVDVAPVAGGQFDACRYQHSCGKVGRQLHDWSSSGIFAPAIFVVDKLRSVAAADGASLDWNLGNGGPCSTNSRMQPAVEFGQLYAVVTPRGQIGQSISKRFAADELGLASRLHQRKGIGPTRNRGPACKAHQVTLPWEGASRIS